MPEALRFAPSSSWAQRRDPLLTQRRGRREERARQLPALAPFASPITALLSPKAKRATQLPGATPISFASVTRSHPGKSPGAEGVRQAHKHSLSPVTPHGPRPPQSHSLPVLSFTHLGRSLSLSRHLPVVCCAHYAPPTGPTWTCGRRPPAPRRCYPPSPPCHRSPTETSSSSRTPAAPLPPADIASLFNHTSS